MAKLANKLSKTEAMKRVAAEPFERTTISLYRYVRIEDPKALRDELYRAWEAIGVLGRVYLSREGINAQVSVPSHAVEVFRNHVDSFDVFKNVPFKIGVDEKDVSFWKLTIKVKRQIVADDLPEGAYDIENVGRHLSAKEWNDAMENPDTVVVDMRNGYESKIGHFQGAVTPDCETFREELPMVLDELEDKKDKKILLYCTGGIRCEKTSAFLRHHGFEDVNQLHGGIIDYAQQVKREHLDNKFIGKNFVFDGRRDETITNDVLAECHTCGKPADTYVDCNNMACHVLFIQCSSCQQKTNMTCSKPCQKITELPEEEQKALRKGKKAPAGVLK